METRIKRYEGGELSYVRTYDSETGIMRYGEVVCSYDPDEEKDD